MNNKTFAILAIMLVGVTAIGTYYLSHHPKVDVVDSSVSLRQSVHSLENSFYSILKSHSKTDSILQHKNKDVAASIEKEGKKIGSNVTLVQSIPKSKKQAFYDSLSNYSINGTMYFHRR